ncbi:MAG: hypothetical protein ACJ72G_12210 [Friedmanniella sp.]
MGSALPCLSFLVVGRLFALVRRQIPLGFPLGLAIGAFASLLVWTGVARPLNIKSGDYGTPVVSLLVAGLFCVALVLVFESLFAALPAAWSRTVTLLASAGLTVVLTHAAVLYVLHVGREGSWLAFLAAVAVPWAVGALLLFTCIGRRQWGTAAPSAGQRDARGVVALPRAQAGSKVDGDRVVR